MVSQGFPLPVLPGRKVLQDRNRRILVRRDLIQSCNEALDPGIHRFRVLVPAHNEATPKLPEKAVKLDNGAALFEVGVMARGGEAVAQKRAVLVDSGGKLLGAECKTTQDATRLLQNAAWLLPDNVKRPNTTWKVTAGTTSAFTLEIERGAGKVKASERLQLDNFGRVTTQGRRSDIVVANYYLDRFEAAV
jgi:hypothetical protein